MRETKITRELRAIGIFNAHGFYYASGPLNEHYPLDRPRPPRIDGIPRPVPFIAYRPTQPGRGYLPWAWQVKQGNVKTDPGGHWRDYGAKTFSGAFALGNGKAARDAVLAEAIAWATEKYGVAEWTRDPFGDYGPKAFVEARLAQLREFARTVGAES